MPPSSTPRETFGRILQQILVGRGESQAALAGQAGVDPSAISRLMSSEFASFSLERLMEIAIGLGCEVGVQITPTLATVDDRDIRVRCDLPSLDALNMPTDIQERLRTAGSFLVVTPDEVTTAYIFSAILSDERVRRDRHVLTVESPFPAYYLQGVSQVALSTVFPFEDAVQALLRMSPDLVGLRGMKTASEAHAALDVAMCGASTVIGLTATDFGSSLEQLYQLMRPAFRNDKGALAYLSTWNAGLFVERSGQGLHYNLVPFDRVSIERGAFALGYFADLPSRVS